jgi:hypothetical protein
MRQASSLRKLTRAATVAALTVASLAAIRPPAALAQAPAFTRLSAVPDELPVAAARVAGTPGSMRIVERSCRALPDTDLRHRIVDIVLHEWGHFGYTVLDQTLDDDDFGPSGGERGFRRPRSWLDPDESARVAGSIAGYWSATADGSWILERQNAAWSGSDGVAARWRDPWSAAFISWVMCEAGLDDDRFARAIAHHVYIDQAIQARDDASGASAGSAYVAYDVGETEIEPGDMLCSARRNAYRSIADRRRALGVGVRSHCDIVVQADPANSRVLVIGGNVRGAVRLKLLAAEFDALARGRSSGAVSAVVSERGASPQTRARVVGRGGRTVFAHLKLRAGPIAADAFPAGLRSRVGTAAAP